MSALSRRAVRFLGSAYAECPKTLRTARELGPTGWSFFVAGLGAALGDVHPDTVAAALGFIARCAMPGPPLVRSSRSRGCGPKFGSVLPVGDAHLMAVRATGLTPLEAILSGSEGEAGAVAFGWQPPYPAVGPLMRRRLYAEALTDRIAGEAYAGFSVGERAEFVKLADGAREPAQIPTAELPQVAPKQRASKESRIVSVVPADP